MSSFINTVDEGKPICPAANRTSPIVILIIGMAGSGKTTLMHRINLEMVEKGKRGYYINLDPAWSRLGPGPSGTQMNSSYTALIWVPRPSSGGSDFIILIVFPPHATSLIQQCMPVPEQLDIDPSAP